MAWDELNLNLNEDIKKKTGEAKEQQIQLAKAYHTCFKTEAGSKVMADLLNRFIINNQTDLNAVNITYEAGYHAGQAAAVHFIMRLIQQAEVI